jgi:lysophospholipase L1-like esterase
VIAFKVLFGITMRTKLRFRLALLFILAISPFSAPLHANQILVFGDSWAKPIGRKLQEVLTEDGHTEIKVKTTPFWQDACTLPSPPGLDFISNWLDRYPQANIVHLSLGANDIFHFFRWNSDMVNTPQETTLINAIVDCIEIVADYIFSIRPKAKVVWSSYDFFRPNTFGLPAEINRTHIRLAEAAKQLADKRRPNLFYIDMLGTFQVTYGFDGTQHTPFDPPYPIPAGDTSLPDSSYPSPLDPFPDDTTHPSSEGYKVLALAQYELFYGSLFNDNGFYINSGLNDAWFNPETGGQGFFVNVFPDAGLVFLSWFTYEVERPGETTTAQLGEPGHRWLTAQGPYAKNAAVLDIWISRNGMFDSPEPEVIQEKDGKIILEFDNCNSGTVVYDIPSIGRHGVVPIQRIVLDNVPLCESLGAAEILKLVR